ncbi:MAG: IS30 family transposase, partial [Saprospiraceae bacterium]
MSHLTLNQRYDIEIGLAKKVSISRIGEIIGKDKSVVSRKLKRNADLRSNTYKAELAHKKATERHRLKPKKKHWDQSMIDYV